jgi:putative Mg2+ transporter-C (MgtC) family protein
MSALTTFHAAQALDTFVSLAAALILGTLIGAERQYRQRTAGLRTNALVATGAAAFVDLGMTLNGNTGAAQVLAYVASGIGFLGAGVIIKEGTNIRGLNTAASLWCSAAVGGFAGADHVIEAALLTGFVLAGNTFLRPLVNLINRTPIDERVTEATYEVHVTTDNVHRDRVRDMLLEALEAANYPVGDLNALEREEDVVEFVATLSATSVEPRELDAVTAGLEKRPGITHATWTASTTD